jgi:hypothetical protein
MGRNNVSPCEYPTPIPNPPEKAMGQTLPNINNVHIIPSSHHYITWHGLTFKQNDRQTNPHSHTSTCFDDEVWQRKIPLDYEFELVGTCLCSSVGWLTLSERMEWLGTWSFSLRLMIDIRWVGRWIVGGCTPKRLLRMKVKTWELRPWAMGSGVKISSYYLFTSLEI